MGRIYEKTLIVDGITPVGAYAVLRRDAGGGSFLLESVVPGERWGRYSILGYRPRAEVAVLGDSGVEPFAELARRLGVSSEPDASVAARFARAHVGVVPYDAVHFATKVEPWPELVGRPVARFVSDATVVVFDNLTHTATLASPDPADLERAEADLARATALAPLAPPDPAALPSDLDVSVSDADYERIVERAKEFIYAGDAFQIVAARTFSAPAGDSDPFDVYRALRVLSPAPYMYLLELPATESGAAVAVAGASPETLVRVEHDAITLRPIAGTRRRGRSPEEDEALAQEMLADPKEIAEHVMLIDLARNDVGRVSRAGSVELLRRMEVERFSHVMHIVSNVVGRLASGHDSLSALAATVSVRGTCCAPPFPPAP